MKESPAAYTSSFHFPHTYVVFICVSLASALLVSSAFIMSYYYCSIRKRVEEDEDIPRGDDWSKLPSWSLNYLKCHAGKKSASGVHDWCLLEKSTTDKQQQQRSSSSDEQFLYLQLSRLPGGRTKRSQAGADPGEVKWVNFHPPPPLFLSPLLSFFFSYPSNIEIIFDFSDIITKIHPPFPHPGSALVSGYIKGFSTKNEWLAKPVSLTSKERSLSGGILYHRITMVPHRKVINPALICFTTHQQVQSAVLSVPVLRHKTTFKYRI